MGTTICDAQLRSKKPWGQSLTVFQEWYEVSVSYTTRYGKVWEFNPQNCKKKYREQALTRRFH